MTMTDAGTHTRPDPDPLAVGRWELLRVRYDRIGAGVRYDPIGPGVPRDLDLAYGRAHRALIRLATLLDQHDQRVRTDAEKAKIRADIDRLEAQLATEKAKLRPATKPAPGAAPPTVREWARANGHTVSPRGKIPAAVQDAYDQAHQDRPGGEAA